MLKSDGLFYPVYTFNRILIFRVSIIQGSVLPEPLLWHVKNWKIFLSLFFQLILNAKFIQLCGYRLLKCTQTCFHDWNTSCQLSAIDCNWDTFQCLFILCDFSFDKSFKYTSYSGKASKIASLFYNLWVSHEFSILG